MKKVFASLKKQLISMGNFLLFLSLKLIDAIFSKWVLAIVHLFFLAGPFLFIYASVANPSYDTTPITNIAFAILAGIASVTFSWARAIDQNEKGVVKQIIQGGELALQAALFFLLASAFKYTFIKIEIKPDASIVIFALKQCMQYLSILFFCIAIGNFMLASLKLCYVLRDRVREHNWYNK